MVLRAALVAILAVCAGCSGPAAEPTGPVPVTADASPPPPPPAAPDLAAVYRERLEAQVTPYIDAMGERWGEAFRFSGLVHVAVGGRAIYSQARGYRDRDRKLPIDADTSFRIGSVTKQFTAAAILELAERGELSVSDTVRKHLPDYPAAGDKITIHQLLTHTAGVPGDDFMGAILESADRRRSVSELIAMFSGKPLDFQPGSEFRYSSAGYVLLGAIIERVSGRPYGDFVKSALFAPAGLEATAYGADASRADRALGYEVDADEALGAAKPIDMSNAYAAGGVRSTAADLVKWDRALDGDAILEAATRRRMYTPARRDYAYGWTVTERDGKQVIEHTGDIHGFNCAFIRIPEDDLVAVIWTNNASRQIRPIAEAVMTALAGKPVAAPVEKKPAPLEAVNARRIAGGYVLTEESRGALAAIGLPGPIIDSFAAAHIRVDGGARFDPIGQDAVRIHAEPADTDGFQTEFFAKTGGLTVVFSYAIDDEGRREASAATTLVVSQRGLDIKMSRDDRGAARLEATYRKKKDNPGTTKGKRSRRRRR